MSKSYNLPKLKNQYKVKKLQLTDFSSPKNCLQEHNLTSGQINLQKFNTERTLALSINQMLNTTRNKQFFQQQSKIKSNADSADVSYLLEQRLLTRQQTIININNGQEIPLPTDIQDQENLMNENNQQEQSNINISHFIVPSANKGLNLQKIQSIINGQTNLFDIKKKGLRKEDPVDNLQTDPFTNYKGYKCLQTDLGPPTGRKDAEFVLNWLQTMLDKYVFNKVQTGNMYKYTKQFQHLQIILSLALKEIIRQIKVQCVERAQTLEMILKCYFDIFSQTDINKKAKIQKMKQKIQEYEEKLQSKTSSFSLQNTPQNKGLHYFQEQAQSQLKGSKEKYALNQQIVEQIGIQSKDNKNQRIIKYERYISSLIAQIKFQEEQLINFQNQTQKMQVQIEEDTKRQGNLSKICEYLLLQKKIYLQQETEEFNNQHQED